MKLQIKKVYFDQIKSGAKKVDYRDAHITFICEETGEQLTRPILDVGISDDPKIVAKVKNKYPNVFEDKAIVAFRIAKARK